MSSDKPKAAPKGDYPIGYARPPKANQFQPGQSGNLGGRPRGRPSLDELLLEEAARVVKFKAGDKVMHMDRDRALMRKLFDMALNGKVPAIQLVIARLAQAQAALSALIAPNGSSLSEVRLVEKGYRLATTVQGPATGKGAHIIIVDDPFKAVEAASNPVRNSVYDWFRAR